MVEGQPTKPDPRHPWFFLGSGRGQSAGSGALVRSDGSRGQRADGLVRIRIRIRVAVALIDVGASDGASGSVVTCLHDAVLM